MTEQELVELSKLSQDFWYRMRKAHKIEHFDLEGTIKYGPEDIAKFYRQRHVVITPPGGAQLIDNAE